MATILQRPSHSTGILLNSQTNSYSNLQWQANKATLPTAGSTQSMYSSSGDSSSESSPSRAANSTVTDSEHSSGKNTRRSSASPSSRRIRFAPLPDPRRSVLVTDDGEELPFPTEIDDSSFSKADLDDAVCQTASLDDSQYVTFVRDPVASENTSPASPAGSDATHTAKRTRSSSVKALLKPFRSKRPSTAPSSFTGYDTDPGLAASTSSSRASSICSSSSPTSSGINISTEEILTLGTINLFRSGSRASVSDKSKKRSTSRDSSGSSWGLPLGRWTSGGSSRTVNSNDFGSPLARTQSSQSLKGDTRGRKPSAPPPPATKVRKGTRMLNGNVYGGRKGSSTGPVNPFANARDSEPQFVEWGHGGMGSITGGMGSVPNGGGKFAANKAAAHADDEIAARWAKLQTSGGIMVGATAAAEKGGTEDDDDDGSGMGWVRKRREERERLKREKEAAEKAAAEAPAPVVEEATPTLPVDIPVVELALAPSVTEPEVEDAPTPAKSPDHVLTAVNVPAPVRHHHHHHSRSASVIGSALNLAVPTTSANASNSTLGLVSETTVPATVDIPSVVVSSGESSDSDSESDDEEGEGEKSDGDDEEEEDDSEQNRKTALGAGVEKISRHKE